MNNWTLTGLIALIIIVCAGTAIKYYTSSKIKEYEGTYDIKGRNGQEQAADDQSTKEDI